jgi:hypothetical protein
MPSNPTPTLRPPRRPVLDEVRLPRLQGLIAEGGIFAPVPEGGRR